MRHSFKKFRLKTGRSAQLVFYAIPITLSQLNSLDLQIVMYTHLYFLGGAPILAVAQVIKSSRSCCVVAAAKSTFTIKLLTQRLETHDLSCQLIKLCQQLCDTPFKKAAMPFFHKFGTIGQRKLKFRIQIALRIYQQFCNSEGSGIIQKCCHALFQ